MNHSVLCMCIRFLKFDSKFYKNLQSGFLKNKKITMMKVDKGQPRIIYVKCFSDFH